MNSAPKPVVAHTEYKEPTEHNTSLGFASSILNGNTIEGGLRSLTYKSIYALRLVEDLDTARSVIVPQQPYLYRISEFDVITPDRVEQLHSEIDEVKRSRKPRNHEDDDKILQYNVRLDRELETKTLSAEYGSEVTAYYRELVPNMNITFDNATYYQKRIECPSSVERMQDVPGFDVSIYQRAAERRQIEQQQEEEKRREAERQQEEARLEAERIQAEAEAAVSAMEVDDFLDLPNSYTGSPMDQYTPGNDSPYLQAQSPY